MKTIFDLGSRTLSVDIVPGDSGTSYRLIMDDKSMDVEILQVKDGKLDLLIDGKHVTAYVSSDNTKRWVTVNGQTFVLTKSSGSKRRGAGQDHASELAAPMPGLVRAVNVHEGEAVTKGQTLLLLEAMKMEIRVQAPKDAVIKKLFVKQGQTVEREQILIEVE
jgi:acetyl/propionyl-CoA carboxylase alpha subunit